MIQERERWRSGDLLKKTRKEQENKRRTKVGSMRLSEGELGIL